MHRSTVQSVHGDHHDARELCWLLSDAYLYSAGAALLFELSSRVIIRTHPVR